MEIKHDFSKVCGCDPDQKTSVCDLTFDCPSNREGGDKWCHKCYCQSCVRAVCEVARL